MNISLALIAISFALGSTALDEDASFENRNIRRKLGDQFDLYDDDAYVMPHDHLLDWSDDEAQLNHRDESFVVVISRLLKQMKNESTKKRGNKVSLD
jgi:hypothetical protein